MGFSFGRKEKYQVERNGFICIPAKSLTFSVYNKGICWAQYFSEALIFWTGYSKLTKKNQVNETVILHAVFVT